MLNVPSAALVVENVRTVTDAPATGWLAESTTRPVTVVPVGIVGTRIPLEVPVIDGLPVSVAVSVWFPPVWIVAENVPAPLESVMFAGSTAAGSLLVKWMVPG